MGAFADNFLKGSNEPSNNAGNSFAKSFGVSGGYNTGQQTSPASSPVVTPAAPSQNIFQRIGSGIKNLFTISQPPVTPSTGSRLSNFYANRDQPALQNQTLEEARKAYEADTGRSALESPLYQQIKKELTEQERFNQAADANVFVQFTKKPVDTTVEVSRAFLMEHPEILPPLVKAQEWIEKGLELNPTFRGFTKGITATYLNSSESVNELYDKQLVEPVEGVDKTLYKMGEIPGQVLSFLAGGQLLKGLGFAKATLPVLFATIGQTSAPPSTTTTQRLAKMPLDAVAGFLFSALPPTTVSGFRDILKPTVLKNIGGVTGIASGQAFVDALIEGQTPEEAAKIIPQAAAVAGLFYLTALGTGLIDAKVMNSKPVSGSTATFTPEQLKKMATQQDLTKTEYGKMLSDYILKVAAQAEASGKNVKFDYNGLKKSFVAKTLKLDKPVALNLNPEFVDKPGQIGTSTGKPGQVDVVKPQTGVTPTTPVQPTEVPVPPVPPTVIPEVKTPITEPVSTAADLANLKKETMDNVLERIMNSGQAKGRLSDGTIKNLQETQPGVNELSFDDNGNITLYRTPDGKIVPGQPAGFSVEKVGNQVPYTINKSDILINTQSPEVIDFVANNYKEDGGQYDRKNMLDLLDQFKSIESEVVVLPKTSMKPQVSGIVPEEKKPVQPVVEPKKIAEEPKTTQNEAEKWVQDRYGKTLETSTKAQIQEYFANNPESSLKVEDVSAKFGKTLPADMKELEKRPALLYGGRDLGVFTDGYIMVTDKEFAAKINAAVEESLKKKELKSLEKVNTSGDKTHAELVEMVDEEIARRYRDESKGYPEYKKIIPEDITDYEPVKPVAMEGMGGGTLVLKGERAFASVNPDFFYYLQKGLPGYTPMAKMDDPQTGWGSNRAVVFVKDGKIGAMVMPVQPEQRLIDKYKTEAPVVKKEVEVVKPVVKEKKKVTIGAKKTTTETKVKLTGNPEQDTFIKTAAKKYPNGVVLYHQTEKTRLQSILSNGLKKDGVENGVHTVFDKVIDRVGGTDTVHIKITVPLKDIHKLYPEDATYYTSDVGENADLIFRNYLKKHPDLVGGDVVYDGNIPKEWLTVDGKVAASAKPPMDQKEKVSKATELGTAAFGKKVRVPANDKELMKLLQGTPMGEDTQAIMKAWLGAWDKADIEAKSEGGSVSGFKPKALATEPFFKEVTDVLEAIRKLPYFDNSTRYDFYQNQLMATSSESYINDMIPEDPETGDQAEAFWDTMGKVLEAEEAAVFKRRAAKLSKINESLLPNVAVEIKGKNWEQAKKAIMEMMPGGKAMRARGFSVKVSDQEAQDMFDRLYRTTIEGGYLDEAEIYRVYPDAKRLNEWKNHNVYAGGGTDENILKYRETYMVSQWYGKEVPKEVEVYRGVPLPNAKLRPGEYVTPDKDYARSYMRGKFGSIVKDVIPAKDLIVTEVWGTAPHYIYYPKGTKLAPSDIKAPISFQEYFNKVNSKPVYRDYAEPKETGDLGFNPKNMEQPESTTAKVETDKIVKRTQIAKDLSEKLNVPIRMGKFRAGGAIGIFKTQPKVVRYKSGGLPTIFHEVAHFLDSNFNMSKSINKTEREALMVEYGYSYAGQPRKQQKEAFAEFMRFTMTGRDAYAKELAPKFYEEYAEAMGKLPEIKSVIDTATNDFRRWNEQPAAAKVLSQISIGSQPKDPLKKRVVGGLHSFYTDWVDDLHPLSEYSKLGKKVLNGQLPATQDPYILARNLKGWVGKADLFLNTGTFDPANYYNADKDNPKMVFTGKSYREIIKPVADANALDDFRVFIVSERVVNDLSPRGIKTGVTKKDAMEAMQQVQDRNPDLDFKKISEERRKYEDSLLVYLRRKGVIGDEGLKKIKQLNKYHVPFYRVVEGLQAGGYMGGRKIGGNIGNPIKKMKGNDFLEIVDPLESDVKNTYAFINAADRNEIGVAMSKLSVKSPELGRIFERVDAPMKATNVQDEEIIRAIVKKMGIPKEFLPEEVQMVLDDLITDVSLTVFRPTMDTGKNMLNVNLGDKKVVFQVEPDLFKAIQGLGQEQVATVIKLLSIPAKTLRLGATLSPDFSVRNPLRDTFSATIFSNYGFKPGIDLVRGVMELFSKDADVYNLWKASGGEGSMFASMDREVLQKRLKDLIATRGEKALNIVKNPVDMLRLVSEMGEQGTRLGEMRSALRSGADPTSAAFASREVTLDFAKMGSKAKAVNMLKAFFSSGINGTDKMVRSFKEHPFRTLLKSLMYLTLPSILLYLAQKDDPRWKELPMWQKNLFWIVLTPNHIYRIPKPFELGMLFSSVPERTMEWLDTKDPEAFDDITKAVLTGMLPDMTPIPTAGIPIIENIANYSFFLDRPIVSRGQENLPPEKQAGTYTSETAKMIGETLNYSPSKIDNLIQGYFGGLGKYAVDGMDVILKGSGVATPPASPAKGLEDMPVLRAFMIRKPIGSNSESVNRVYRQYGELSSGISYLNKAIKDGETEEAKQYIREHPEIVNAAIIKETVNTFSDINKAVSQIRQSREISPEDKKVMIEKLGQLQTDLAAKVLEQIREENR